MTSLSGRTVRAAERKRKKEKEKEREKVNDYSGTIVSAETPMAHAHARTKNIWNIGRRRYFGANTNTTD